MQDFTYTGRELAEIIRTLARVDANLEALVKSHDKQEVRIESQEKRLSWVESKVNWAAGVLATATFILSFSLDFIKGLFK